MDLGYEYAFVIRMTIFIGFFAPLQPILLLFGVIALALMYLVNKYKLFNRFHRPKFHTTEVNDYVNIFLLLGPISFALGHLYVFLWVEETNVTSTSINVAAWFGFGLATLFLLFPFRLFYKCIDLPELPIWDYNEKYPLLPTDYDRLNPQTKNQAIGQLQH